MDAIRTQIEYYFSDENLSKDAFFNNEMSKNEENWLDASLLLACRKLRDLNVTTLEMIEGALKESDLKTKKGEDGKLFVRRDAPLPLLHPLQTVKGQDESPKPRKRTAENIPEFAILRVSGLSEETTWQEVKTALNGLIRASPFPHLITGGVRNVARPDEQGRFQVVASLGAGTLLGQHVGKVTVNNAEGTIETVTGEEFETIRTTLPEAITTFKMHRGSRKDQKARQIHIGEITFASDRDLQRRVRTWMDQHPVDTDFDEGSTEFTVLKALFAFHPRAEEKGYKQLKSFGLRKYEHSESPDAKAFHVIRQNDTSEDFSVKRCIELYARYGGVPPVKFGAVEVVAPAPAPAPIKRAMDAEEESNGEQNEEQSLKKAKEGTEEVPEAKEEAAEAVPEAKEVAEEIPEDKKEIAEEIPEDKKEIAEEIPEAKVADGAAPAEANGAVEATA